MLSLFQPKAVKQGRQFAQDARKMLAYKRDLWSEVTVVEFEKAIEKLEKACDEKDERTIEEAAHQLNTLCLSYLPKVEDASWRENVEVFLVAIVVALAVRTYFLQPFTIPTGSMQPTLNGILGFPTEQAPPNALTQLTHTVAFGRTWINTIAKDDEMVVEVADVSRYYFFSYAQVRTKLVTMDPDGTQRVTEDGNTYLIHAPARTLTEMFNVDPKSTRFYRRGEPIARGYVNTGDHVFVDKLTYHFRNPRRGDVFVFNTESIPDMGDPGPPPKKPSQFYIKRLAGLPLDEMRVAPPELFINGKRAEGAGFERVMAAQGGYQGYSNAAEYVSYGQKVYQPMRFLGTPDATFTVPEKHYYAMGDNSFHSSDSRHWGPVPQENIMGRGIFVYWPFGSHFGLIW